MAGSIIFVLIIYVLSLFRGANCQVPGYGVLMTEYGCPSQGDWNTGSIDLSSQDGSPGFSWSEGSHTYGLKGSDNIKLNFCISRESTRASLTGTGSYCVFKTEAPCPPGHEETGDELQIKDWSSVDAEGAIPQGSVSRGVRAIRFCCQQGSGISFLRYDAPFLITKAAEYECPVFSDMRASQEFLTFPPEVVSINQDVVDLTENDGGTVRLNMCYYEHTGLPGHIQINCPSGWVHNGLHCYLFSENVLSWYGARRKCQEMNAQIMSVESVEELTFLNEAVPKYDSVVKDSHFTLGMNDLDVENVWVWSDNVPIDPLVSNWDNSRIWEPNNYLDDEDCGTIWTQSSDVNEAGKWNDEACDSIYNYICKRFILANITNIAHGKDVYQSTEPEEILPRLIVDTKPGTCSQTMAEARPWFQIDFYNTHEVQGLRVIRGDYSKRSVVVSVGHYRHSFLRGDDIVCADSAHLTYYSNYIMCKSVVSGRYLTLSVSDPMMNDFFELCEVEIFGSETSCGMPLGLSNGDIGAIQMTSSSYLPPHWPTMGRLNTNGIWCASPNDNNPTLTVDFGVDTEVESFIVQGDTMLGYASKLSLSYGSNQASMQTLTDNDGSEQIFTILEAIGGQYVALPRVLLARYITLHVVEYEIAACLKLEFFGCKTSKPNVCPDKIGFPPDVDLPNSNISETIIAPQMTFKCQGKLKSLSLTASMTGSNVLIGIARWTGMPMNTSEIIHIIQIYTTKLGVQIFDLRDDDITVNPGDFVIIFGNKSQPCPIYYLTKEDPLSSDIYLQVVFISHNEMDMKIGDSIFVGDEAWLLQLRQFSLIFEVDNEDSSNSEDIVCGGAVRESTTILSPNFPLLPPTGIMCTWTFTAPENQYFRISPVYVSLGSQESRYGDDVCSDVIYLQHDVTGVSYEISQITGEVMPLIVPQESQFDLIFDACVHHSLRQRNGFVLDITLTECAGCGVGSMGDGFSCTLPCGYITSPMYPHMYPDSIDTTWNIEVEEWTYIELTIHKVDLQSIQPACAEDHLLVNDVAEEGGIKPLARFCNVKEPSGTLKSSWNKMQIRMIADQSFSATGMFLEYQSKAFELPDDLRRNVEFDACSSGEGITYQGHCYTFTNLVQTILWAEGEEACQKQGGHLVSIMSKEEMTLIQYLLSTRWRSSEKQTYIGLTDGIKEGLYQWTDRRPMIYAAWATKVTADKIQPDGGELEDCTLIRLASLSAVNQWHDIPCALNDVKQYICKSPLDIGQSNETASLPHSEMVQNAVTGSFPPFIKKNLFQCGNEEYILMPHLCDGKVDCSDLSDEANCSNNCPKDEFQCISGECIDISLYCDYMVNCQDGSDESGCVSPICEDGFFQCSNGECISRVNHCDLIPHCSDGSDEVDCATCRQPDTFQCFDGRCIPWHARCDGVKDCAGCNDEDEALCFWSVFTACGLYDDLECSSNPLTGIGEVIMKHNFDGDFTQTDMMGEGILDIAVTYFAPSSDNEIQSILLASDNCFQTFQFASRECQLATRWISINGDMWLPSMFTESERIYLGTDFEWIFSLKSNSDLRITVRKKLALPVINILLNTTMCPDVDVVKIEPFICNNALSKEGGSILTCDNNQKVSSDYLCIFEFDEYGIQKGCRDMSHLNDCGQLKPLVECYTDIGRDYRGFVSKNSINVTCQRWDMQTPHSHKSTAELLGVIHLSDANNYCRNPGKVIQEPYCYTIDPDLGISKCGLPKCKPGELETYRFQCPENYFPCPGDYCIPYQYLCDGNWQCPNGEDEVGCDQFSCPGFYHCLGSSKCLIPNQICDGIHQCPLADDERYCNLTCPQECSCQSFRVDCQSRGIDSFPTDIQHSARLINLNNNKLSLISERTLLFPYVGKMFFSGNSIHRVTPGIFHLLNNLLVLDLSHNQLTTLERGAFDGLSALQDLNLQGNSYLMTLNAGAFMGLSSLPLLNLSEMSIQRLTDKTFDGLVNLQFLDIENNDIIEISDHAFIGLNKMTKLELEGNDIKEMTRASLKSLPMLTHLRSDHFKLCCMAEQVDRENCHPPQDPISSCQDLMSNNILRSFIWIFGIMAFLGNVCVVAWRMSLSSTTVPDIIITNLGISDFLMGLYMLIIAGVDLYYQGVFIEYSDLWRDSWLCQISGFLATFSSEGSVMFLAVLTVDRFINILFPFSSMRFSNKTATRASIVVWLIGFVVSVIPFVPIDYFGGNYYGRSGVCMALPITNETPPGWEYSTFLFVGFNFVGFLVIGIGYTIMYFSINRTMSLARGTERKKQITLAKNMMLIVLTDFICWLPIIAMGMAALRGATIPGEVYAWIIVFVLPINSAINPILYTFAAQNPIKKLFDKLSTKFGASSASEMTSSSIDGSTNDKLAFGNRKLPASGIALLDRSVHVSFKEYIRQFRPKPQILVKILCKITEQVNIMHEMGLSHGNININKIFIVDIQSKTPNVMLVGVENSQQDEDAVFAKDDINGLGNMIRDALRISH